MDEVIKRAYSQKSTLMSIFRNSVVGDRQKVLPHLVVFLGSGGDFIGYLLGG